MQLGSKAVSIIEEMGRMLLFLLTTFAWLIRPPFRPFQTFKQLHFIGYKSMFVVILTAAFTGMVLGLQGYYTLRKFGSEALLGSAVALSMIRELGPVLAALMVTARAGNPCASAPHAVASTRTVHQVNRCRRRAPMLTTVLCATPSALTTLSRWL